MIKNIVSFSVRCFRSIHRRVITIFYKSTLQHYGESLNIDSGVFISSPEFVTIGDRVTINRNVIFQSNINAGITIGNNVVISYDVKLLTGGLIIGDKKNPFQRSHQFKSISIGDNVWIGAGSIILAGVNVDSNVVIAANSLVNKDLKSGYIYGGQPAKIIKELD